MNIALIFAILLVPTVAWASPAEVSDAAVLSALEQAFSQPISWQLIATGTAAALLWIFRSWKEIAAIDTWKEVMALAGAIAPASFAALSAGSSPEDVIIGAIGSFMIFVKLNSAAVPPMKRKKDGAPPTPKSPVTPALLLVLFLSGCAGFGICDGARASLEAAEAIELSECLEEPTADEAEACGERVGEKYDKAFRALDGDASR